MKGNWENRITILVISFILFSSGIVGAILPYQTATAQSCVAPPSGLIGWWDGDSVSGTTAVDIASGNDGIMLNGVTIVPGKVGNAFLFDGVDDTISIPGTFGGGPELTIDAWIKTDAITNNFHAIVSSTDLEFVHIQVNQAAAFANNVFFTDVTSPNFVNLPIIPESPTGVYRHVAISIQSGDSRLYVDGVLVGIASDTFSTVTPTSDLHIGSGFQNARLFIGEIDEIEIFDRALTESEIQSIFSAGSAGKCKIDPIHSDILTEVVNIEEKLDGDRESLITLIFDSLNGAVDLTPLINGINQILGILQDPNFGLEEIKTEVEIIETEVLDPDHGLLAIKDAVDGIDGGSGGDGTNLISITVNLNGKLKAGDFKLLSDITPFKSVQGHVAMKVPCEEDGETPLEIVAGVAPDVLVVAKEFVADLSNPGKSCLYHLDLPADITDVAIINTNSPDKEDKDDNIGKKDVNFGKDAEHTVTITIEVTK